jgi:recombination protein RecT
MSNNDTQQIVSVENKQISFQETLRSKLKENNTLKELLEKSKTVNYDQFIAKVIIAVLQIPTLDKSAINSILSCCLKSAQLGLPVDASGYAYIVPRWNKNTGSFEASYQIGYKGYIELVRRNPKVKSIDAFLVTEDEVKNGNFCEIRGTNASITYKPDYFNTTKIKNRENTFLSVAIISYVNGGHEWEVMTKEEIVKAKQINVKEDKNGKDEKFSPWTDWWGEMAKKTVLRRLLKRCCLMNVETAIELDEDEQYKDVSPSAESQVKSIDDLIDEEEEELKLS